MQDLLAILIAAAAAAFLARRAWQRLTHRRAAACGSCSSCNSTNSLNSQPLVTISPIISHAKAQSREEVGA
jgi:hypothetical protein